MYFWTKRLNKTVKFINSNSFMYFFNIQKASYFLNYTEKDFNQ